MKTIQYFWLIVTCLLIDNGQATTYWRNLRQSQPQTVVEGGARRNNVYKNRTVNGGMMLRGGLSSLSASCPAQCTCQGLSVDCSSRGLKHVPRNIPLNAIKMYLFGLYSWKTKEYHYLFEIFVLFKSDLQGNQISKIRADDFTELKNLKVL